MISSHFACGWQYGTFANGFRVSKIMVMNHG